MKRKELSERLAYALLAVYDLETFTTLGEYFNGELRTLMYLRIASARKTHPSDLAAQMGVTKQRITTIISSLKDKGLIETRKDEEDKRKMVVTLSENGRLYLQVKEQPFWRTMNYTVDKLGEEETKQLISWCRKIKKLINDYENKKGKLGDKNEKDCDCGG